MANKIFEDPTATVPRSDPQFVRVPFPGSDLAGRQDFIPNNKRDEMNVKHVSTTTGSK